MNRKILPLLLALAAGVGCAPNHMSLEAYAICAMPDECRFSGKCEAYHAGPIIFFSDVGNWLELAVEMRNQVPDNTDLDVGRVNTNDAHVTGVALDITTDGENVVTSLSMDMGHHTVPAGGTSIVWSLLMPPAAVVALPTGNYVVNARFVGYRTSGREFETPDFPVPVYLDATLGGGFGCADPTEIIVCGGPQQNVAACAAP